MTSVFHVDRTLSQLAAEAGNGLSATDLNAVLPFITFLTLMCLEGRKGLRRTVNRVVRQSYFSNLGTFLINEVLMSMLSVSALWTVADRYASWGLLGGVSNRAMRWIGSLLLLDLLLYFWHRANHSHDCLWAFHRTHHSDRCMNVSTSFRLHGVELACTTLLKALFIIVVGVDSSIMLINEAIVTLCVVFHHANVAFAAERHLGLLIVVPHQHRVHHSTRRCEHDNNYGAIFSFWDRWFETFADVEPTELGLPNVPCQSLYVLVKDGLHPFGVAFSWAFGRRDGTAVQTSSVAKPALTAARDVAVLPTAAAFRYKR